MKKRQIALFLAIVLLAAAVPLISLVARAETVDGTLGENVTWSLDRKTGAFVLRGTGLVQGEPVPDYIISREDLPLFSFPWDAYREEIRTLTVEQGVTGICIDAFFGCSRLRSVVLPQSVALISGTAFGACPALQEFIVPNPACHFKLTAADFANQASTVIYGFAGSTAQTFASQNGFRFSALPSDYGNPNPFIDVFPGTFCHDAVLWAVGRAPQITNGTSQIRFSPSNGCMREQVVTFLWRAANCPEPQSSDSPFTDVAAGNYYTKAILWANEKGIVTGVSPKLFGLKRPCTRAQVVTLLWRAAGSPKPKTTENPFTDVGGGYYHDAVLWAVENGITKGTSATSFSPGKTCTRAQVVTFLQRAAQLR